MATYVILSRFSPDAFREPKDFKKLAEAVSNKIKADCRGLKWKHSFATLGVARRHRQFIKIREEAGEEAAREHVVPQFMPLSDHRLL